MKPTRVLNALPIGKPRDTKVAYLHSVAPRFARNAAPVPPLRLQHALALLEDLQKELTSGREEWTAARQQIARLTEANARLRHLAAERALEVAKATHLAYYDELTGLPNRSLLFDRFNQALARAKRQGKPIALLLLDLDGFKAINDRLGHAAGDKLLQQVAGRLQACIRSSDTACRYGGDEFVLLLPEAEDEKRAWEVARKVHARLAETYFVDGHTITVRASIGIAVSAAAGVSRQELIKQADMAMYLAKTVQSATTAKIRIARRR